MSRTSEVKTGWIRSALERFEAPLTRYAFCITGDLERARDVVQETFLCLCSETPTHLDGRVAPWLFKVCRNRALDVRKKEARTLSLADGRSESRERAPTLFLRRGSKPTRAWRES